MHVASVTAPVVLQHLRCITVCKQYVRAASVLKSTYFVHGLILKLSFRSISSNAAYTCCIRVACDILFCRSEIMQHKCFCCNALHFMHETHTGRCSAGVARFQIGQVADMGRSTCLLSSPLPLVLAAFLNKRRPNMATFSNTFGHTMQLFRWHHQVCIERTCMCHLRLCRNCAWCP